jgi:hypothetical protein
MSHTKKRGPGGGPRGNDFSGYWVLDRTRSESPATHLDAIGLPDMAQTAAEKLDIAYYIYQEPGAFTIKHESQLGVYIADATSSCHIAESAGEKERRLVIGEEIHEAGRDGSTIRIRLEQAAPNQIKTLIDW